MDKDQNSAELYKATKTSIKVAIENKDWSSLASSINIVKNFENPSHTRETLIELMDAVDDALAEENAEDATHLFQFVQDLYDFISD